MKSEILQKLNEITTKLTVTNMSAAKLKKKGVSGDFLFKENEDFFFDKDSNNAMFIEETLYNTSTTLDNLNHSFSKYVLEFCSALSLSPNKHSIIFYNSFTPKEKIVETLGLDYNILEGEKDWKKFNQGPSAYFETNPKALSKKLRTLLETRGKEVQSSNVYVFVYSVDDIPTDDVEIFLTLARSRKIYLIGYLSKDTKLLQSREDKSGVLTDFDRLCIHCMTKYICDSEGPVVIERFRRLPIYLKDGVREKYLAINPPQEEYKGPLR